MVLGRGISLAQIAQAAVLFSTVSCGCWEDGGPAEPPPQVEAPIASVEILPARVSVQQNSAFTLRARVRDQWGNILPDYRATGVKWGTPGGINVPTTPGASVVVTATPTATLPQTVYVTASVNGEVKVDSSTIQIVGSPESASNDWIFSDHTPKAQPSYVFLDGKSNYGEGSPINNAVVSFVREGALAPITCPSDDSQCGTATIFSPNHGVTRAVFPWKTGCDMVSFVTAGSITNCQAVGTAVALPARLNVPVVVWTLAKGARIDQQVQADKAYAEWVFGQPLVGLTLAFDVHPYDGKHGSITHGIGCKTSTDTHIADDLTTRFPNVRFDTKKITVVYVDGINPGTGDDIGFTCPYDAHGTVIIISANAINNSTLAHELGHALGQWHSAERDHPDVPPPRIDGFEPSNLMWSSESDWGVSLRRNLTLGQLFQMSLADFSFVKRSGISTGPALRCSTDPGSSTPCAVLARDER